MLKSDAMKENKEERSLIASLGRCRTLCRSNCVPILSLPASPKLQMSKITPKYIQCHIAQEAKGNGTKGKPQFGDFREVN